MSTQFATGEDYPAYQAGITAGVAAYPTNAQFITAYNAQAKALYTALKSPISVAPADAANLGSVTPVTAPALPSVGINVAGNTPAIFDWSPQRYTL